MEVKDYLVSGETFELYHDPEWDILVTRPQPADLSAYYESKNYKPHQHHAKSLFDTAYNYIRKRSYRYKMKLIKKFHPSAQKVLDYGTATGEFLYFLSQETFSVSGVEPNKKAREQANLLLGDKVRVSIDEIDDKFDVITLWHVLEHLPHPEKTIGQLKEKLAEDGILIIAVPNFKSYDALHYGEHWAAYDVPRHLWHFSPLGIKRFFEKFEMEVLAQRPLFFDSFYVSLLSEQYKTGKKRILPAVFRGLLSNFKARQNGNYSSLIYILKPV